MAEETLRHKTLAGIVWTFLESFSLQGFGFIQGIILARLLLPEYYGLIAMTNIFFAVSRCFINSGFTTALIRKKDRTALDYSTTYVTNVVLSFIFAFILYNCSPFISDFYSEPELITIVRYNAVLLFLGSLIAVQSTRLTIELKFKVSSTINVISTIITGLVTITLAFLDFGVWSLIYPGFADLLLKGILFWYYQRWHPGIRFSWQSYKQLFSFGSKLLVSGLLDTIYNNIYPIIIGRFFSAGQLGFYSKADSFAGLPSQTTTGILAKVAFPVLSKIQDDDETLSAAYRRMIRTSAFIIFPMMMILAAVARSFVLVLISDVWATCIPYLIILCFARMWWPIHVLNLNLLQVKGRSDLFLRLEIIKKIMGVSVIFLSFPFGLIGLCVGSVASSLISLIINTYYTGKLINVGIVRQMKDMMPSIIYSVITGIIVFFITLVIPNLYFQLIVGLIAGVFIYVGLTKLTDSADLQYLYSIIKPHLPIYGK